MAMECLPKVSTCFFRLSLKIGCVLIAVYMMVIGALNIVALELEKEIKRGLKLETCIYDHLGGAYQFAEVMELGSGVLNIVFGMLLLIGALTSCSFLLHVTVYMLILLMIHFCVVQIIMIVGCFRGLPALWTVVFRICGILLSIILGIYFVIVVNSFQDEVE